MKRFLTAFSLVVLYTATVSAANSNISRTIPTKNTNENTVETNNANNVNRATISRNVVRTNNNVSSRKNDAENISRSVNARKNNNRATLNDGVNNVGRNARVESQSINANPALRRAGITLRASTAEVGGRATLNNGQQTGSNIDEQVRGIKSRASFFGTNKQKTVFST